MTLHPISGTARRMDGAPVARVVLIPWTPTAPVLPEPSLQAQPDTDGAWTVYAPAGRYGVLYVSDDCQPEFHGPYQNGEVT